MQILKNYFEKLQFKVVPRDGKRPKRGTLRTDKAKKLLGYKPKNKFGRRYKAIS